MCGGFCVLRVVRIGTRGRGGLRHLRRASGACFWRDGAGDRRVPAQLPPGNRDAGVARGPGPRGGRSRLGGESRHRDPGRRPAARLRHFVHAAGYFCRPTRDCSTLLSILHRPRLPLSCGYGGASTRSGRSRARRIRSTAREAGSLKDWAAPHRKRPFRLKSALPQNGQFPGFGRSVRN